MTLEEFTSAYSYLIAISRADIDKAQKLDDKLETKWDPPLHMLEDVVRNRFEYLHKQLTTEEQIIYYVESLNFSDRYLKYHELLTEDQLLVAKFMI